MVHLGAQMQAKTLIPSASHLGVVVLVVEADQAVEGVDKVLYTNFIQRTVNSLSIKYSRLANPIILLFVGILGVVWGSTFFMVILLCIGLLLGIYDTYLKNNDIKIVDIYDKLITEGYYFKTDQAFKNRTAVLCLT